MKRLINNDDATLNAGLVLGGLIIAGIVFIIYSTVYGSLFMIGGIIAIIGVLAYNFAHEHVVAFWMVLLGMGLVFVSVFIPSLATIITGSIGL